MYSTLYQQWSGKERINCSVWLSIFLHTNDVHACYNAVELFEVFMIKQVYFVVNFTFLFSSLANTAF